MRSKSSLFFLLDVVGFGFICALIDQTRINKGLVKFLRFHVLFSIMAAC